ncbi:protein O7 [macacine betaherpesvirus 3]|nr:protein O7 [macacine betaherpesvirus 3]QXV50194.1 protein O7 [macacine betaherpesvirus 3]
MSHPRIAILGILTMGNEVVFAVIAVVASFVALIMGILLDLLYLHAYQKFCNYYCCCPFQRLSIYDAEVLEELEV